MISSLGRGIVNKFSVRRVKVPEFVRDSVIYTSAD